MREFVALVNEYPITFNAATRHLIIKASFFTDKKVYIIKLKKLMAEMKKKPVENFKGIKVVITGILAEPEAFLDAFVENNIAVIADDLAQESRQFRTSLTSGSTALERLAIRMTNQECAMLYDETKSRGQRIIKLVKETNADAVIVSMLKFCDPEEFDFPIFKNELKEAKIPMLYLEIEQTMNSVEQIRTRIQSFAEMLK
ncbi:(R)-2-hydroxyisocaproyl-CoA dehydratase beta subunit [bioreactor metagenome]|uniref:(R)-2-hydroxyisocaproyl-CoA dehydratase beta subunit n=1 Tax=bioreactor metagenome TaxID=1076179 RepID=A0A645HTN9_9ZZZZ